MFNSIDDENYDGDGGDSEDGDNDKDHSGCDDAVNDVNDDGL